MERARHRPIPAALAQLPDTTSPDDRALLLSSRVVLRRVTGIDGVERLLAVAPCKNGHNGATCGAMRIKDAGFDPAVLCGGCSMRRPKAP